MRTSTTTDNGWLSTERRVGWAIGTARAGFSYPPGIKVQPSSCAGTDEFHRSRPSVRA